MTAATTTGAGFGPPVIPGQLDFELDDERLPAHWEAPGAPCHDCGRQTIPEDGHEHELGGHEWYMVNDDAWPIGHGEGFLCVECLETRLERRLTPADFPPLPVNEAKWIDSPRLRDRKGVVS
jgi:hypothetical protein